MTDHTQQARAASIPDAAIEAAAISKLLLAHSIDTYQNQEHDETRWFCTNDACAFETDNWHGSADEDIAKHHAEALTAAGFGQVRVAKAGAWDEGWYERAQYDGAERLPTGDDENPYLEEQHRG